ncbi:hypothetical protein ACP70R_048192 [Stipagrostis hirtigluma subsp. patula]
MPSTRGSKRKNPMAAAGAGADPDRFTALPLELRAHIASFLPYEQIAQLTVLSRPWLHIHHHTPVIEVSLTSLPGLLRDEDAALGLRAALRRRTQEVPRSKVDALSLGYIVDDLRMRGHADRIIALADASKLCVMVPDGGAASRNVWTLELPPAARHLEVTAVDHLAPAIAGPGAAALRKLVLSCVVVREWPHLPSLRSLALEDVTVEAAFAPGAWCPLLEELDIFCTKIEQARVDIRLPLLKFLDLDELDVCPSGQLEGPPFGYITVDAPELVELDVNCEPGSTVDYKSFTLRAPRLRLLRWYNQFAKRVHIDVGRPGSVKVGRIKFMSIHTREIKYYRVQMMLMLQGLLPNVPPESVADVTRPYRTRVKYTEVEDGEVITEEKITCDLRALMSCGGI